MNMIFSNADIGSQPASIPSGRLHRSTFFKSMGDTTDLPYGVQTNGCKLCYTQSKSTYIYKPHSDTGMVGCSAAGYLARRRRI